ncbi:MAG TPA: hypothetical protein VJP02_03315 [Candidatus Sulfotelmatobacter sp.]|nr:hypothetical protein [Candidatus Sulfotelmatobacter sp.]
MARRYRCDFVDLLNFKLNPNFLKRVPPELMFRYNFLPLEDMFDGRLAIAIADPSQLLLIDEISLLLGRRLVVRVAALSRISEILHGIDPNPDETPDDRDDQPPSPGTDSPVCAPKKPRPHLRSAMQRRFQKETSKAPIVRSRLLRNLDFTQNGRFTAQGVKWLISSVGHTARRAYTTVMAELELGRVPTKNNASRSTP